MSKPVDLDDLASVRSDYGTGYLLTVSVRGGVKVVAVDPLIEADGLVGVRSPGQGSLENAVAEPRVTLLFPPDAHDGMSLLVDGTAQVQDDDLLVRPTSAILHRPAG